MPQTPQTGIQKSYADTTHGQVHYRYALSSAPVETKVRDGRTVVMFHKSASSSASFEAIMSQLVPLGFSCYALDMPGFGNSFDPSPEDVNEIREKGTRWYVDVFASALSSIGILGTDRPKMDLMGHHSGASLAPELAALFPQAVSSVCLIGTAVMSAEEREIMREKYFAPFNKPVGDGGHLLKTWDYLKNMGVGDDIDLIQREAVCHIRAWKGRNQIYGAIWEQDLAQYLDALRCPVMFVCARDDVLWDYQEKAKGRWTSATYVECRGANFSLDLDARGIIDAWKAFKNL